MYIFHSLHVLWEVLHFQTILINWQISKHQKLKKSNKSRIENYGAFQFRVPHNYAVVCSAENVHVEICSQL